MGFGQGTTFAQQDYFSITAEVVYQKSIEFLSFNDGMDVFFGDLSFRDYTDDRGFALDIKVASDELSYIATDLGFVGFHDNLDSIYYSGSSLARIRNGRLQVHSVDSSTIDHIIGKIKNRLASLGYSERGAIQGEYIYTREDGSINQETVSLRKPRKDFNEAAYPYIEGGALKLLSDFYESDESILILLGPAGTGKTSLIREYIYRHAKNSPRIVYGEDAFKQERTFLDFLFSDSEVMVMEDADLIMSGRMTDGNRHMSKILNMTDGLVDLGRKKFIFTANLKSVDEIDHALTRAGRCFGVIETRELTPEEIESVFGVHTLGDKSVAEVMANKDSAYKPVKRGKVGFF